jgi:hypothetical protein
MSMADGGGIESTPTALYRHFDKDGKLLYVGISLSPTYRLSQHRDASRWFPRIASIKIEWLPSRDAALDAECDAIKAEDPEFNVVHKLTAREMFLQELADESRAELNRKVVQFDSSYSIAGAAKAVGLAESAVRLALLHGDLPFISTGSNIIITGWAVITYVEALQAGAAKVRAREKREDGTYVSAPNIETILAGIEA